MRTIAYIRVSTAGQGESGLSIEAQRAKLTSYAELYELEIVAEQVDVASAKTLERPGMERALDMLASGEADALLFAKLDRATRSVADLQALMTRADDEGWALHSVADRLDTSSASGRLVASILATVAQWEREVIAERTSEALKAKQRRGEHIGNAPFGWRLVDGELVKDEDEQARITQILDLREQGLSYRKIAAQLSMHTTSIVRIIKRAA